MKGIVVDIKRQSLELDPSGFDKTPKIRYSEDLVPIHNLEQVAVLVQYSWKYLTPDENEIAKHLFDDIGYRIVDDRYPLDGDTQHLPAFDYGPYTKARIWFNKHFGVPWWMIIHQGDDLDEFDPNPTRRIDVFSGKVQFKYTHRCADGFVRSWIYE